jgi:hypothetical protein
VTAGNRLSGVRWLWETERWDGPLSGYGCYQGQTVRIALREDRMPLLGRYDADGDLIWTPRTYDVFALSAEQLAAAEQRHDDFKRWVGTHCDFDQSGTRRVGAVAPSATHHLFYDKYGQRDTDDVGALIGWFSEDDQPTEAAPCPD